MKVSRSVIWIACIGVVHGFLPPALQSARLATDLGSSTEKKSADDTFVSSFFESSECDDMNVPPSLSIVLRSLQDLPSGSDIRGVFVDHKSVGSVKSVARAIGDSGCTLAPLTPFCAHCLGYGFAQILTQGSPGKKLQIAIGRDPRPHGSRLADAFARGAESVKGVKVAYTGLATTPAMFEFCRANLCEGGVMVTASHLPVDRNGFKFFTERGGFSKADVDQIVDYAKTYANSWHDTGLLPPTSGGEGVFCSEWVDHMPHYASTLRNAILREVSSDTKLPLAGLKICLNAGNGSGGFFHDILKELGADVSSSMHIEPNGDFPAGVPNPEDANMLAETTRVCQEAQADIGIMLDTDADRCGFVVPRSVAADGSSSNYEALNRNRLIALLSVIFSKSSPGCAIVTDSVTSEGLADFLQNNLGLQHVRYLKGYANVINKASELTSSGAANAEMAIETSGHCAMRENGYLDDGTYTAVKVVGLLAREMQARKDSGEHRSLLDLISDLKEMPEEGELRMKLLDGSLESTAITFDLAALQIEQLCEEEGNTWSLDNENLEGIRVRTGNGGFFMLRKSLHDPLISLQVEGVSRDVVRSTVVEPLLEKFKSEHQIGSALDLSALDEY